MQRNPLPNHKRKGVVAVVIHGNPTKAEEPEGSFHPSIVKTLQKNPKFRSLFNLLGFGPEVRKGHRVSHEHSRRFENGMFYGRITC